MSNGIVLWDATPGDLYELDWLQCNTCKRWHQVSEEFLQLVNGKFPEATGVIAVDPEGTTGPGTTCVDCGGLMGRWIPADAIGSRSDGSYIKRGDPEDPNRDAEE